MKLSSISGALLSAVGMALALPAYAADYYLIVPLPAKIVDVSAISVGLNNYILPSATAGLPYSGFDFKLLLSVNGDPDYTGYGVRWDIAAGELPAGLTLDASTGILTGTPVASGAEAFTVRATYKTQTGVQVYRVVTANLRVALTAARLPPATKDKTYAALFDFKTKLSVTGDPAYSIGLVNFSATDLPPGIALSGDGVLSGKPAVESSGQNFTVKASYKGADGQQVYTLVVNGAAFLATQITASFNHSCAVTTTGGVKCWGSNTAGQLGDGSTTDRLTPVDVNGLGSGVSTVTAGLSYTCALLTTGAVKCWGANSNGQLGDGTFTRRTSPVAVQGLSSGVAQISGARVSGSHTCAVTTSGGVLCWGSNNFGQLGDSSSSNRNVPVAVTGLGSGVASVAAGTYHSCAVTTAGAVKCWGYNGAYQLGDGTKETRSAPVSVTGLSSGVASVTLGYHTVCALTTAGEVKCLGYNYGGQLGDGTEETRSAPVVVRGLPAGVTDVTAGLGFTCAQAGGSLTCWGVNYDGQLGEGTTDRRNTLVSVTGLSAGVQSVVAGSNYACAITSSGLKCWGYNGDGQLGDGTTVSRFVPTAISGSE